MIIIAFENLYLIKYLLIVKSSSDKHIHILNNAAFILLPRLPLTLAIFDEITLYACAADVSSSNQRSILLRVRRNPLRGRVDCDEAPVADVDNDESTSKSDGGRGSSEACDISNRLAGVLPFTDAVSFFMARHASRQEVITRPSPPVLE